MHRSSPTHSFYFRLDSPAQNEWPEDITEPLFLPGSGPAQPPQTAGAQGPTMGFKPSPPHPHTSSVHFLLRPCLCAPDHGPAGTWSHAGCLVRVEALSPSPPTRTGALVSVPTIAGSAAIPLQLFLCSSWSCRFCLSCGAEILRGCALEARSSRRPVLRLSSLSESPALSAAPEEHQPVPVLA